MFVAAASERGENTKTEILQLVGIQDKYKVLNVPWLTLYKQNSSHINWLKNVGGQAV